MSAQDLLERAERRMLPPPITRRAIRIAAGVQVAEVAEELGICRQAVYKYEDGTREPRGQLRERYAELLRALKRSGA